MRSKKGVQEAGAMAAAALIVVITLLIVAYILFLPPAEREKLLIDEEDNETSDVEPEVLLSETPERIYPITQREFEQDLPSVNIFIKEVGTELKKADSLFVSRSLFSDKNAVVDFEILEIDDIRNVLLNFVIQESTGR